ncbi:MAG: cytochrome b/b6 domain-containing protein [Mucispirillum sp.]|uniref:Cytochrome b/b6 domain-containing protein n=1 Tax=Candidatus Mucispirillum faecigallinarum TaxID=2838699 RepID=A0A9D2GSP5_9BACT|nr:cytochrome b/b6 domain-containing protein [Mucispirillum sp.]HIZ88667.1 cytochrome b/b6 domain-containing protein [Candidatus Mucispirillum faecigallinarum]
MKTVIRHTLLTRIEHWGTALSGIMLYGTHEMQDKSLHICIGIAFSLFLLLHIIRHLVIGFDALMRISDIKEGLHVVKSFFVKNTDVAPQGKFLPEQRVVYTFCGILCILVAVSGTANIFYYYYPDLRSNLVILGLWYMHHVTAALFVAFFVVHIFFLLLKPNRYLIPSMFTGRISLKAAQEKHPKWNYEK